MGMQLGNNPDTGFNLLAMTPVGGFALQNATPTILTWNAPNDGQEHRINVIANLDVSVAQTGGQVDVTFTDFAGNPQDITLISGGNGVGLTGGSTYWHNALLVKAGTIVSVIQKFAMTAGSALLGVELWGS